jgi:hypothetical protein
LSVFDLSRSSSGGWYLENISHGLPELGGIL